MANADDSSLDNFTAAQEPCSDICTDNYNLENSENKMETLVTKHLYSHNKVMCGLCQINNDIAMECLDCKKFMCKVCASTHQDTPTTSSHRCKVFELLKDGQKKTKPTLTYRISCEMHSNEEVTFFCNTDDILVCVDCVIGDHRGHDCVRIEQVADQERNLLVQAYKDMESIEVNSLSPRLNFIQDKKRQNQKLQHAITEAINRRSDELVAEIRRDQKELLQQNRTVYKQTDDRLENIAQNIQLKKRELKILKAEEKSVLGSQSAANFINVRRQIISCLSEIKSVEETCAQLPAQMSQFSPGINVGTSFKNLIGQFTPSEINIKTISVLAVQVKSKYPEVTSMCTIGDKASWIRHYNEKFLTLIDYKGKVTKHVKLHCFPSHISKVPDGGIMVCSYDGQLIKKISPDGSTVTDVATTEPLHPRGLGVTYSGDILVCLVDECDYIITKHSHRCVIRMTWFGQTKQTMEYDKDNSRLFTLPHRVLENPVTHDICVVDGTGDKNGHLCILDIQCSMKTKYMADIYKLGVPFNPVDLACDHRGQIIVCDFSNQTLHLLDCNGQFVCYLLTHDKNGLEKPTSLALDAAGDLWIGNLYGQISIIKYLDQKE